MNKISNFNLARWGFLAVSLLFIIIGVMLGENETVLRKAINICLECIGVG